MTIKIKGLCTVRIALPFPSTGVEESLITIKVKRRKRKTKTSNIPTTLLERIQACSTAAELMDLMFATPLKNEAIMAAFDQRIEELEEAEETLNIQPLKHKNNGSTTPTTAA